MKRSFLLGSVIFSLFFASCENNTARSKASFTGYWSVESAFRDKRETKLLADVFFQFSAAGKMLTNLPNISDDSTDFELKGDILLQKANPPISYNIQDFSDSTLVLALVLSNTPFEIHLKKTSPPPQQVLDSVPMESDSL